jgi:hypothetical protein
MKTSLIPVLTTVSCTVASLSVSAIATAVELSLVEPTPTDWIDLEWKAEGRAGAFEFEDYEFAIGPDGAQADNTGQIYLDWENGVDVNWQLDWDGTNVLFTVGEETISYTASPPSGAVFDGFSLLTNVKTEAGFVEPDTHLELTVNTVNAMSVDNIFLESIAPETGSDLQKFYWESDEIISSLAGTTRLSWDSLNPNVSRARSRVDFQIVGYDINAASTNIPEPATAAGLLTIGGLMALSKLKKPQQ